MGWITDLRVFYTVDFFTMAPFFSLIDKLIKVLY